MLHILTSGNNNIYDSTFINNEAPNGAVIFVDESRTPTINIHGSRFEDNKATGCGIILSNDSDVNIYNSTFANNTISGGHGVIVSTTGAVDIENSIFTGNSSFNSAVDINSGNLTINNSIFENNYSTKKSAVASAGANVIIKNSIFRNNASGGFVDDVIHGGALQVWGQDTIIADGGINRSSEAYTRSS